MRRCLAALLAAMVVSAPGPATAGPPASGPEATGPATAVPATAVLAAADAPATEPPATGPPKTPFETVPLPTPVARPHKAAYACIAVGAGLIATSFSLADRADTAYDRYLTSHVPEDIRRWFDEATRYDQWSSAALLGGEAMVATGLYLRFLRRPPPPVAVVLAPGACVVSYRF